MYGEFACPFDAPWEHTCEWVEKGVLWYVMHEIADLQPNISNNFSKGGFGCLRFRILSTKFYVRVRAPSSLSDHDTDYLITLKIQTDSNSLPEKFHVRTRRDLMLWRAGVYSLVSQRPARRQ